MKSYLLLVFNFFFFSCWAIGQNVGVNNSNPSQQLDVNGKIKISSDDNPPEAGTIRFDTATLKFQGFDGFKWIDFGGNDNNLRPSKDEFINPTDGMNWTFYPKCVINNSNQAAIAYITFTPAEDRLYASIFDRGIWNHPANIADQINPIGTYLIGSPEIAMDENGSIIILYLVQFNSTATGTELFMAEYVDGIWITKATSLHVNGAYCHNYNVAMADNGEAIIGWLEDEGGIDVGYIAEKRDGSWDFPTSTSESFSQQIVYEDVEDLDLSMNDSGDILVSWTMNNNNTGLDHLYLGQYIGGQWHWPNSEDDYISLDIGKVHYGIRIRINNQGKGVINWAQDYLTSIRIYVAEYNGQVWDWPVDENDYILNLQSVFSKLSMDMDDHGNIIVMCIGDHQTVPLGSAFIFRVEKRAGNWILPSSIEPINNNIINTITGFKTTMANNCDAAVLLTHTSGNNKTSHYILDFQNGKWNDHNPHCYVFDYFSIGNSDIAMNDNGDIIIAWAQVTESTQGLFQVFTYFK